MENKAEILTVTNYGLNIYAHILRVYYPNETVLHLVGRDCGLCRNPFANGESNLHIWIEKSNPEDSTSDECARHHDTSGTIPDGDAFTFAEQHYHLTGDALLEKIAEEMNIARKNESTDNEITNITPEPVGADPCVCPSSAPLFSFFRAPITSTVPYKSITLFDAYLYIIGKPAQKRTADLRAIADKTQAKRFKSNCFDYCCFSGIFTKRNANALVQHSGLMCIDFDHLPDPDDLRQKLLFDEYFDTQLLFRSPSGDGLKWIIPVDLSEYTHGEFFEAVAEHILQGYGVQIDKSGSDFSRACFLPYDPHAYINPEYLHGHGKEKV
jgi:hypothetical protein